MAAGFAAFVAGRAESARPRACSPTNHARNTFVRRFSLIASAKRDFRRSGRSPSKCGLSKKYVAARRERIDLLSGDSICVRSITRPALKRIQIGPHR